MTVRAKMKVTSITKGGDARKPYVQVKLGAVYSSDPQSENRSFACATPSGELSLNIDSGRPAADAFELGGEYYVDVTPCGVPERVYLGDYGMPNAELVVEARDKSKTARIRYENGRLYDGAGVETNVQTLLKDGFEFWRHLKEGE